MKILYLVAGILLGSSCTVYTKYASEEARIHCSDCPSEKCICIQGEGGVWYISPEVGE